VVEHEPPLRVWAARFVAPLAFFAAATVLVVLVQNGLNDGSAGTGTGTVATTTNEGSTTTTTGTTTGKKHKRIYRVRQGDTLESIAAKFHTTVDDLLQLNPDVDPLALSPGQRIRVS
jgi:LysM repeat protein